MQKHRFSYVQRYALWHAYDGRCFYCEEPLGFQDMTIDHIVPEWLQSDPLRLAELRAEYELDCNVPGFQVNSFKNWVPAHPRKCNARKGGEVFPKRMTLMYLHQVQRRLPRIEQELAVLNRGRNKCHVLGSLSAAVERKHITIDEVHSLLQDVQRRQHWDEPLVLTFGLTIAEVEQTLPKEVPRDYPRLCDWLEADLVKHLRSLMATPFHYTEPSARSGEGLSVRIVFPGVDHSALDRFDRPWWQILEAATFWEIFEATYADAYPKLLPQEHFGELESD